MGSFFFFILVCLWSWCRVNNSDCKAVEELNLNAEYWENENDQYDKNSDFSFCGQKITMQEYEQYLKDFAYINPYDMPRIN